MGKFKQRFVIKFLFIKGLRSRAIQAELDATFGATVNSQTRPNE
jgi:hypothetical protein